MRDGLNAVLMCAGLVACGAPVDEDEFDAQDATEAEELGTSAQALSSSCGTSTPDYSFTGLVSPTLVAPSGSGCTQIVDINNINLGGYYPPVLTPAQMPTNQADCEAARVRMYIWDKTGSGDPVYLGSSQTYGVWTEEVFGGSFYCSLYKQASGLVGGRSYRFGLSAEKPAFSYINLKFYSNNVIH